MADAAFHTEQIPISFVPGITFWGKQGMYSHPNFTDGETWAQED